MPRAMSATGHRLPAPIPVGGSAMARSADLAGTFRGDADAPIPAVRRVTVEPLESTDAPSPKSFKKGNRSFASSWLDVSCGSGGVQDRGQVRRNAVELDPKRNAGHLREDRRPDRRCLRQAAKL